VKKILGYGFIDRYSGIYMDSLLSNIGVTIVSLALFRNPLALLIGIIMIILDVLLTTVLISFKDNKSIVEYTKRG
jgi:ABC-type transport system involved in cytochrome bd biosynthesis fused ATPase/permease subunit